jgi:Bacterial archaeo-eukaryotic release factor family 7
MDMLNPTALKSLIAQHGKWCVSIYMPTHPVGRDQQQNPIRLKNLLAEAETKLLANGLRRPEAQKLMLPAEELLWNRDFWQHQGEGLAIFLTNDFSQVYRLPVEFEEQLHTGNGFYIKPLLPSLGRGIKFYVLAISLHNVRLFEGNADTMSEIKLNFPTSMQEALWTDEPEKYLNMHSGSISMGQGKGGAAVFHGHDPADEEKTNILRFFQSVNEGLNDLLDEKNIPMILAGVDYLLPIYREASSYQNLLEDAVMGNPEREKVKDLHAKAWKIVQPLFEESQKKAFEKFEQLNGQKSDLAVKDIKTAVKAATVGQVETIFVPLGKQKWGQYDAENHNVIASAEPGPGNEDLFDLAATQTILNSGQVFAVPPEQMPGGGEVAAILRYSV